MRTRVTLLAVLLALALPVGLQARFIAGPAGSAVQEIALPERLGAWSLGREARLGPEELAIVEPDAHLLRIYEAESRTPAIVYVGLYAGRAGYGRGAHDPEVCYPAAGWEILDSRKTSIPLAGGEPLHVTELTVHRGSTRQAVVYWFQPAERWPSTPLVEELLRILDALVGRPQYAFVRLSTLAPAPVVDADGIRDLATRIAPAVRAVVSDVTPR